MNAVLIALIALLLTIPAFGQSSPPAKIYKWQHPWFKKEITSPTPPTWPYRIVEEKNGVVRVEVTPPGTPAPKAVPPPAAAIADHPATTDVSKTPLDTDWPFTVPVGTLECRTFGKLHIVTITSNGITYAVNGTARSRLKELGLQDSDDIWKRDPKDPETRVSSNIVKKGMAICGTKMETPAPIAPPPDLSPAPQPVIAATACDDLGEFARMIANARQRGLSMETVEANMIPSNVTQKGLSLAKDIISVVYKRSLTPDDANMITVATCKVMLISGELEKGKK